MQPNVILLGKTERFSRQAAEIAEQAFGPSLKVFLGKVGDPEPEALSTETPDFLISFLSPWIVRKETLDANPELKDILESLSAKLDDAVMQRLNSQVDVEKKSIEQVATDFLKESGLS